MGKICKEASVKHNTTLSPAIAEFLTVAKWTPLHKLPSHLANFPKRWPFPRGDLYHWITALNRFDNILELFNEFYALDKGPQCTPFTRQLLLRGDGIGDEPTGTEALLDNAGLPLDGDRVLVEEVVSISRLLIENCGNRSLYASSNLLSNLLNTSSSSLLGATLHLSLRLAQRYSSSRTRLHGLHYGHLSSSLLQAHYNFDLTKIEKLAQPFAKNLPVPSSRDKDAEQYALPNPTYPVDLLVLVMDDSNQSEWVEQFGRPWLQYYDAPADPVAVFHAPGPAVPPSPLTPTGARRSASGLSREQTFKTATPTTAPEATEISAGYSLRPGFKLWQISIEDLQTQSLHDLTTKQMSSVPKDHQYEVFHKTRVGFAMTESVESRRQMIAIRLLALANIAHIYPGHMMQDKILQYEHDRPRRSQLPVQLCDLLQPPGRKDIDVPKKIRTMALETLDALCNDKLKAADVCAALSINVNHGVLSYTTRQSATELSLEHGTGDKLLEDIEWYDALFTLLHTIPKCASRAGEGFVAAGILDILTEALTYRTVKAEWNHPRVIIFLDVFVYNTRDAFQAFVNAKGLDVVSQLLTYTVKQSLSLAQSGSGLPAGYRTHLTDYQIPFALQQTLKQLLKFTHDMMSITGGPFDRLLRNLIESSELLDGLRTIIENPPIYGSNVWSASVDIFSSFIHNEPTSYAAIAEAGLTTAFLATITQRPRLEVTSTVEVNSGIVGSTPDPISLILSSMNDIVGRPTAQPLLSHTQLIDDIPELTSSTETEATVDTWTVWTEEYDNGILPVVEAIAILPHAFGAICLNESGLQQFEASNALKHFFHAFICPLHVRALSITPGVEVENIGSAFDELARHHPRLRPAIIDAVWKMLAIIHHLAYAGAVEHRSGTRLWTGDAESQTPVDKDQKLPAALRTTAVFELADLGTHTTAETLDTAPVPDLEMRDAQSTADKGSQDRTAPPQFPTSNKGQPIMVRPLSEYVAVISRFLHGFFGGSALCTPFAETPGPELLLDLAISPSLPFDFAATTGPKVIRVIQTLALEKPHLLIPSIIRRMRMLLHRLQPFLNHSSDSSFFADFVTVPAFSGGSTGSDRGGIGTATVKALNALQVLCIALTKSLSLPSSRSSSNPLGTTNFTDYILVIIHETGKLQSRALWEIIHLQRLSPQVANASGTSIPRSNVNINRDCEQRLNEASSGLPVPAGLVSSETQPVLAVLPEMYGAVSHVSWASASAERRNYMVIRYLLHQLPSCIAQLFGAISKSVLLRRLQNDSYQKHHSMLIASQLAQTSLALLQSTMPSTADEKALLYFRSAAVSLITPVLLDKKTDVIDRTGPQLLTLTLSRFKQNGGLLVISEYAQKFFNNWVAHSNAGGDDKESLAQRSYALNGLNHVLGVFKHLTSSKCVTESHQTSAMASRPDRDRERPEFFLVSQFLLELRCDIMRAVKPIWESEEFSRMEPSVIQNVADILRNIKDAHGELGASKRSDKVVPKAKSTFKKWKLRNTDNLTRLYEHGFDQNLALEALYRCCENLSMAQEYCARYLRMKTLPRCPIPSGYAEPFGEAEGQATSTLTAATTNQAQDADRIILDNNLVLQDLDDSLRSQDFSSLDDADVLDPDLQVGNATDVTETANDNSAHLSHTTTVEDLDDMREDIRVELPDRCLAILYVHDTLTFELADLLTAGMHNTDIPSFEREKLCGRLLKSLQSFLPGRGVQNNVQDNTKRISACAYLFGIIIQDSQFFDNIRDELAGRFDDILEFLSVARDSTSSESPKWVASLLLIIERLLAEDAQPHQISWSPPREDQTPWEASPLRREPLVTIEVRLQIMDHLLDLLPRIGKDPEFAQVVLRVLVILTRHRRVSTQLASKCNLQRLFLVVKQLRGWLDAKVHGAFMLILRHLLEDDETIKQTMRSEIQALFRKHKQLDTTTYIRHSASSILRSPELFVHVTNELLMLPRFDRAQVPQTLVLRKEHTDSTTSGHTEQVALTTLQAEATEQSIGMQAVDSGSASLDKDDKIDGDGVVHYLLSELLAYKDVLDDSSARTLDSHADDKQQKHSDDATTAHQRDNTETQPIVRTANDHKRDVQDFNAHDHPIFVYRCFILQCLTEILQSYNRTKLEFINFSRKSDPQPGTPSRPRSGAMNYFLNVLIPLLGTLQHPSDDEGRKKASTSDWAESVVVSLCARTPEKGDPKRRDGLEPEDEPSLMLVRKFVVEHVLKIYKDASMSTGPLGAKYSRLLSLADLLNRMLAGKSVASQYSRTHEDFIPTQKVLARIMFEKNFIGALTSSIADVDLNFPDASRAVKYILRPLKLLTYTAVDLSLTSSSSISLAGQTDEDEISTTTSVSEANQPGDDREETPDLFRNSTLGMFEPSREDESSSASGSEDEDDEEMYGEDYADDMEYDEDERAHDDDVVSEEDDEMVGIGPVEGLSGDMGMEVEIEMDEDDEDDGDDDDDEDDDEDDEDGEGIADSISDDQDAMHEVLEEIAEGIDEHGEEWEDDDEGAEYEEQDGDGAMLDIHGATHDDVTDASGEELDGPPLFLVPAPFQEEDTPAIHDHEGAGEEDSEVDEEEDEDDYDEDEVHYHNPGFEDEESETAPFAWGWPPQHGRYASHNHQFGTFMRAQGPYRSGRSGPSSGPADGVNPLLVRQQPVLQASNGLTRHLRNSRLQRLRVGRDGLFANGNYPSLPTAEELSISFGRGGGHETENGGAMSYISELINALGHAAPPLTAFSHGHHGGAVQISMSPFTGPGGAMNGVIDLSRAENVPQAPTRRNELFSPPQVTMDRWMEEARLLYGSSWLQKSHAVVNYILRLLVPPALEAEQARKLEQAAAAKKFEEEAARLKLEQEATEKQEREERTAAAAKAAADAEPDRAAGMTEPDLPTTTKTAEDDAMEGVESSGLQSPVETNSTGPPQAVARVFTTIRGRQLDITDLGIDVAYLEALPEDMREEVIAQQYAEQRSQAVASGGEPTTLDREFLDALPPEIRRELLQQEADDRRRREREEARRRTMAANGSITRAAEDMDPASFFASLDPVLRRTVLAETDDDMLTQLPPDIAAEARALGIRHSRAGEILEDLTRTVGHRREADEPGPEAESGDKPRHRTIVQMLDKSGIATLLRLMFLPIHNTSRHTLNGILSNACGNRQTRGEVVTGLLSILQDGSADVGAVEKSFAQLSLRAKQTASNKTPQSSKKSIITQSASSTEASPLMVVGQCLSALTFLTKDIPQIPQFFVTEQEALSSSQPKFKGKGKGKESSASHYPINALLGLLDRSLIVENSAVMEQLAALLQNITQPLAILLRKDREQALVTAADPAVTIEESSGSIEAGVSSGPTTARADASTNNTDVVAPANAEKSVTKADLPRKTRIFSPPEISEENLRLTVNIYTARDCGAKAFRDALGTMSSLSTIPGARRTFGEELIKRARELGGTIHDNLSQLIEALESAEDEMEAQGLALVKFSPTGSDQAKLNRILTALDYIFEIKSGTELDLHGSATESTRDGTDLLVDFHEDPAFTSLWHQLSLCLSATQQSDKYFFNIATILLPLIEALMVVCKRVTVKDPQTLRPGGTGPSSNSMKLFFFTFSSRHKKVLNDLVRQNPKLMSGSFSVLIKNSSVLEFDNKRNFFTRRLHQRSGDMRQFPHPTLQLNVKRDQVFLDSYKALYFKSGEEIKYGKFNIRFANEEGVDAGGVTREWFQVLARQMFNPDYALFNPVASDRTTFHPNRLSGINEEHHLSFFKFIGRIIGKALYENHVLDCHFSRAVYKRILGKAVTIKDMETLDLDYAKSMEWILENDITDIISETFSIVVDKFGLEEVVDLIPNGRNIAVTDENKHEYVRLIIEHRLTGSVQEQLESFLKGFHDIVSADLISIFDEGELELLISGMPDVDVDDWKNHTEYHNYNAASPQIQWLWRAVRSFDKEERAKLLQFVTGTGKVPLNGFKELEGMNGITRFSVHKDYGDKNRLPSSHTCFNQLDLPEYESYEALRKALYTAMTTGNDYFGFA